MRIRRLVPLGNIVRVGVPKTGDLSMFVKRGCPDLLLYCLLIQRAADANV